MPVSQELLDILVCPETRQPVAPAPEDVVRKLAETASAGKLRNRGGNRVDTAPSEGLLREDGRVFYPVEDDIPVMLIEESIEL
jgi:uncharacterized protein YbaR (Trm112 family)